ncbi:MAG: tyrosine-protein phosphatase [Bacteroidales bacterium]|jgi:protein-tyrosine phosphatase|nr:tyrosine-protein phosphatase [Bacteroidales bacterium]
MKDENSLNIISKQYINSGSKVAEVIRDKDSKNTFIFVMISDNWKLYSGRSDDNIDMSTPILEGNSKGIFPIEVSNLHRHYFLLETAGKKYFLSERLLPMKGAHNFRDIGGIKTKDGKYVKWGKLFRSGELSKLIDNDKIYLDSIPIKTIVDFRDYSEVKREPDALPALMEKRYHFPLAPGNLAGNVTLKTESLTSSTAEKIMKEMYKELVSDDDCLNCYRQFFALIQNTNNLPLLYHCTAGKDRTGMATALIYLALGVELEDVLFDYLLSNEYLEEKYGDIKNENEFFRTLLEVTPDFLYETLEFTKKKYGSIDDFLTNVLNVDIDKMKKIYLYS